MVFLHPEYLWGLLALSVPIIIHLFDFRRNRKVYFSDIRFLKQVKHASRKPLKLKQLLILASRLGFITFLVLVFVQPTLQGNNGGKLSSGTKLIYVDNSLSMTVAVNANETALDRARFIGQKLLEKLPQGQELIVVNNDNLSQFWMAQGVREASDKIASLNYSSKPFSLPELGKAIRKYELRGETLSDVFIIGDFQKSTFDIEPNALDTTKTYWLAPVSTETIENCVVDSVFQVTTDISSDDEFEIKVIIKNTGPQEKPDLPVKVFIGDRQVSATTVTIPAYQRKNITFSLGKANNFEQGYIQIEDFPVSFDNQFYFTIPRKKTIHVLDLTDVDPSKYIKDVFGNKNVFALKQGDWRSIDYSVFEETDFVVLDQVEMPDPALLESLKRFAQNGGGVLVVPGSKINVQSYKVLFSNVESIVSKMKELQPPSENDPFFSNVLETTSKNIKMPEAKPVWSWGRDRSALISFEDNTPYLSEVTTNMFFISAPLIDSMSSVQTHALFVPIMYKLVSRSSVPGNRLFERVDNEFIDVEVDSSNVRDLFKLRRDDIEIIPDKRKIGNKWRLTFPEDIISAGIYGIEVNNRFENYVAFNPNMNESQLEALNKNEITRSFTGYKYSILDTYGQGKKRITSINDGIALWKYALVISLLFLLSEALLIRFL